MDRRSFVKTAVGVATAGAVGASAVAMTVPLAKPRPPPAPEIPYFAFHKIGGPAPRGVPLIPVRVNDAGAFEGVPLVEQVPETSALYGSTPETEDPSKVDILQWYKYCGHGGAPGLRQDWAEDSVLRYFVAEDKLALGFKPWFRDLLGKPMRPEHFTEPGMGASFIWRSQGQSGPNTLSGVIMRWKAEDVTFNAPKFFPPAKPIRTDVDRQLVLDSFTVRGEFLAASTFCTHFCCIPGYKEAERLAASRDAADKLFCTCHFSIYDARNPVLYTFSPEVEGSDSAAGGAH